MKRIRRMSARYAVVQQLEQGRLVLTREEQPPAPDCPVLALEVDDALSRPFKDR